MRCLGSFAVAVCGIVCGSNFFIAGASHAQVIEPLLPRDLVSSTVTATVSFDPGSGLYTYSYSIKNKNNAQQNIVNFRLETGAPVLNPTSPVGWHFYPMSSRTNRVLTWIADAVAFDSNGNIEEPPATIKPSETLAGFSFQSRSAPGSVTYYAQGFTKVPSSHEESDFDVAGIDQSLWDFRTNSDSKNTQGPVSECDDAIDNDSDGTTDAADPGCRDEGWPVENPACNNGIDDDGDSDSDFPVDSGCHHEYDLSETLDCSDGIDSNLDGYIDFPSSPFCTSASDATEDADCRDAIDNDGDGTIDYPDDDGCQGPYGLREDDRDGDAVSDAIDNCPIVANAGQEDQDSDGAGDACDNCLEDANGPLAGPATANQCDTDSDGYGNICDGDLDGDGFIGVSDSAIFTQALMEFFVTPENQEADMDCNGFITVSDGPFFTNKLSDFFPGPSGYACAGTAPCPIR